MELNQRIDELEGELKIVKNEVQSVLLDIREHVLSRYDNPFRMASPEASAKKEQEMATMVNTDIVDEEPERRPPEQKKDDQSSGASQIEEAAAATSQLKALMDQIEREKEALQWQQQVVNPTSSTGGRDAQSSPSSTGAQSAQSAPQFQPAPAAQPYQAAQFQPAQAPPPAPGFGPSQGGYRPPERDRWQRPAEPEREHISDNQDHFPGPGVDPRERRWTEEETTRAEGRRNVRRSPVSPRPQEREMERRSEEWDVGHKELEEGVPNGDQTEVNLLTLVGLVRWAERSTSKIGKERVEAVVEIYQTAGCLPASYKDVIPHIIRLADGEKPEVQPTMGDSLNVLLQLDSLLGKKFKTQAAILSTLFGDDGGYPWTKQ